MNGNGPFGIPAAQSPEEVAEQVKRRLAEGFVPVITGITWSKDGLQISCTETEVALILRQNPTCALQVKGATAQLVVKVAPPG